MSSHEKLKNEAIPPPNLESAATFLNRFGERHTYQTFGDNAEGKRFHPQIIHGAIENVFEKLAELNENGQGIFFMVNEGDGHGRSTENVTRIRAVFVDLDGAPLEPVIGFVLKPHIVVQSSESKYHAYWLVEDFPMERFTEVQKLLIRKFDSDKSVHDLPRVLRVPGFNHQKGNPQMVEVIQESHHGKYRLEHFQEALKDVIEANATQAKVIPISTRNRGAEPVREHLPSSYEKMKARCAFIRHCEEDAVGLSEPKWFASCSNVARCEDGRAIFHEISQPYPRYSYTETENKIDHTLADTGPQTCAFIESICGFGRCSGCEWRGQVTSPVQLGTDRYDDELPAALEGMNRKNATVLIGDSLRIIHEINETDCRFLSPSDFRLLYENRNVKTVRNGVQTTVNVGREWIKWERRRDLARAVFAPQGCAEDEYNLYSGMAVEAKPGTWTRYREHIFEVIASGDERIFKYLLDYMARIVQFPGGDRPEVAVVLRGEQGTGKGVFVENFGKIFGENRHYLHLSHTSHLVGNFNSHLSKAIVVFADEAYWAGNRAAENALKALISEKNNLCEAKGRDAIPINMYVNIFMASNNDWVVPAGQYERRYFVLDVSSKRRGDHAYFAAIQNEMDNGGREALLHDLLHRDISGVNLRNYPRTKALTDNVILTLGSAERFWYECLHEGSILIQATNGYPSGWPSQISNDDLEQAYLDYCKAHSLGHPDARSKLLRKINDLCPGMKKVRAGKSSGSHRPYLQSLPSLDACRKSFSKAMGIDDSCWDDEEDDDETW